MNEPPPDSAEDPIDEFLVACLQELPHHRAAALEGLCQRHPEHAIALRRRYAFLEDCGLAEVAGATPPERIGGFRLLRRIGRGGMGVVYLAEQESLGRRVALKMIHPGLAAPAAARERFLREVHALSRLDHRNICPIHDAGEIDGVPYLAMRYVDGETLAERIARQRAAGQRPHVDPLLRIGEQIARALHAAHEKGLVHRDVKPDNVMLEAGTGEPLLLDFGLAQLDDDRASRLTRPGDQLGTPAYMAPEQVRGMPADRRTDVYGLGATLYEALTFRIPHEAPTREALYRRILDADVSGAGSHNQDVPRDLEVVLATALERDPERRYATAREFADELRRVRGHQPIRARAPGPWTRLRRWSHRHPAGVLLALAAVVLGTLGVGTWLALEEFGPLGAAAELPKVEPLWATFVSGPRTGTRRKEECVAIRLGPGRLVTIVGQTESRGLGTEGAWQQDVAGEGRDVDTFVARYDPTRQIGERLLWLTYVGGTADDYVFDAEVDPRTGVTTIVGMTQSHDFPADGAGVGKADGFVAQVAPDGASMQFVTRVGGSGDDRLCEVELTDDGRLFVAGITESDDLPRPSNLHHGGGTDAFVALLDPNRPGDPLVRCTYLGGGGRDNQTLAWLATSSTPWVGNLDWMAMTLAPDGSPAVVFKSWVGRGQTPAETTPDALQSTAAHAPDPEQPGGTGDVYFAVVDPESGELRYATYLGGRLDENPCAIAPHPDGGFVIAGATWSPDLPCTPGCFESEFRGGPGWSGSDMFVCWIDPLRPGDAALRYLSYLGTDAGEDLIRGIAIGRTGVVTLAGCSIGGGFPVTHEFAPVPLRHGAGAALVQLVLSGQGATDLRFSACIAGPPSTVSLMQSVVLDADGAVWATGVTTDTGFPIHDADQPVHPGGRLGFVLALRGM